jgi:hypothetical protein
MDGSRVDALARALTAGRSRRGLTRLLGGLTLGGPLALLGLAPSAAKHKGGKGKKKHKKPACPGQQICNGACIPTSACCNDYACDPCRNAYCRDGSCQCNEGEILSNGRCGVVIQCLSTGEQVNIEDPNSLDCCSLLSHVEDGDPPRRLCDAGALWCLADADCVSGPCRGFACPEYQYGCPGGPPAA